MIADSTVLTTISAPTPKASTASTVVRTAAFLPSPALDAVTPGRRQGAGRIPGPLPRHPHSVPADSRHAHQPVQQPPPPLRPPRVGLAAGGDAGLGQHRPNAGSQLRGPEIPQPPPRHPRRHALRPLVHRRIIPSTTRLGRRPGLPTMFPAQAASLGNREASPSLVYGARLLSGFGVHPPSCVRIALPPLCAASSTDRAPDYGSGGWGFESLAARRMRRSAPIKQEKLDGRVSGSVSPWVLSAVSRPAERYSCCCLRVWSRRLVTVSASRRDATCCRPGIGTADPSRQHAGDDGWLSSSTCRGTA